MCVRNYSLLVVMFLACLGTRPLLAADTAAGEQKSANCVGCHGPKGKSNSDQWPHLAAQQASYLVKQLSAFKTGARNNLVMQAMAANLTDEDMTNLAVYYASQPAVSGKADAHLVKSGQVKAAMCQGCHGSSGQGNGQFPRLAGQRPDYLVKQLNSFKEGKRSNGQMKAVAGSLSEEDMKALAAYFSAL